MHTGRTLTTRSGLPHTLGRLLLGLLSLGLLPLGPDLSPSEAAGRSQRFVRVKVSVANLRTAPSRDAQLVRRAHENEPLRVVGEQGEWVQVRDSVDEVAWIHAGLIDGKPAVVVVRHLVNVRERPGTENAVAFTAERGVNLRVLDRSGHWLRVRHDVGEGWILDSLVWGAP